MSRIFHLLLAFAVVALAAPARAQQPAEKPDLHIDIPVQPKASKVVFNMGHPAFAGDQPIGLMHMQLMARYYAEHHTPLEVIAIFHGAAGYMLLNDQAYDRARKSAKGNPYKEQIAALQQAGIQFEECGQTARSNGWTNTDLLPGIKVDAGANLRLVQLMQDGFVQLQP